MHDLSTTTFRKFAYADDLAIREGRSPTKLTRRSPLRTS